MSESLDDIVHGYNSTSKEPLSLKTKHDNNKNIFIGTPNSFESNPFSDISHPLHQTVWGNPEVGVLSTNDANISYNYAFDDERVSSKERNDVSLYSREHLNEKSCYEETSSLDGAKSIPISDLNAKSEIFFSESDHFQKTNIKESFVDNQKIISSHENLSKKDINSYNITVSDPQKIQKLGSSTFTIYKVSVIYTSINSDQKSNIVEFVVNRRYSDFALLNEQLVAAHPCVIVPGVPEKQTFGRFHDKFIEMRRRSLENFLKKIIAHPILKNDPFVKMFLESSSSYSDESYERLVIYQQKAQSGDHDEWFESRIAKIDLYESQIKLFLRESVNLQRRFGVLVTAHLEFGESLSMLCEIENPQTVGKCLERLLDSHKHVSQYLQVIQETDLDIVINTAEDQLRTISAARTAYRTRAGCFYVLQSLIKQQQKNVNLGNDEKSVAVEKTRIDFDKMTKILHSEMERIDFERIGDFLRVLQVFAESINFHQKEISIQWEELYSILAQPFA